MKLTSAEILQHLGFDISDDGVEINPNDTYLIISALHLVGQTINISQIPDAELIELRHGLIDLVSGWTKKEINTDLSDESLPNLRETLKLTLRLIFNFKHQFAAAV